MLYTNRDTFILSSNGCEGTQPDSLETIMAGNEAGANGCCLSVGLTADGIAVLCADGSFHLGDEVLPVSEHSYFELHRRYPKIVTIGQAVELAKCCAAKIAISLTDMAACSSVRLALATADMLDNAYVLAPGLIESARLARRFPGLHIVADLVLGVPEDSALVNAAQETGLFGLRVQSEQLSPSLVADCRRSGMFLVSRETSDLDTIDALIRAGVNFIETRRPDLAFLLVPSRMASGTPEADDAE